MLILAAGLAGLLGRTVFAGRTQAARPELRRLIDQAATGPRRIASGVTAFVSGLHGTWLGSAGIADVKTGASLRPDARMRLESVGKISTAAPIERLDQEGKLRVGDTVEKWLPGLLPYGSKISIRQLLTMSSGLVDDDDLLGGDPEHAAERFRHSIARVQDPRLRAQPGGSYGYKTNVWVNGNGTRVGVVLFNGRSENAAGDAAQKTLQRLYCAA